MAHRILIVGGGFGGITAAQKIASKGLDTEITLMNPTPWLTYYGVLYRLISHPSALAEACVPLGLMLDTSNIQTVIDAATAIDPEHKTVKGKKSVYTYDTLILAPGSMPAYFNIPGMEEHSITMKTMNDALGIRKKVTDCIEAMKTASPAKQKKLGTFIIVGAGPTGIEIAGEIRYLSHALAKKHGILTEHISIHLIEAMDRLLPALKPSASAKVFKHLQGIDIQIHLNTAVASAEKGKIALKDGSTMEADTIIWTAGVRAHPLLEQIPGIELDKRKRVVVDAQLRAKGQPHLFVLGDCASTPFAGMAQTAVIDGAFAAKVITAELNKQPLPTYKPIAPEYAIPAGRNWAAVKFKFIRAYGLLGYLMRRAADIHVYMLVLPWKYVLPAFFGSIDLKKYGIAEKDVHQ